MAEQVIEIKKKAFAFLARREHSIHELRGKLEAKGFDAQLVSAVLIELIDDNYLSEARYIEMMIRYQYERGQGQNKIRQLFRKNQVDNDLSEHAFNDFDGDWLSSAKRVRLKRFGELIWSENDKQCLKEKSRQMNFLIGRGFEMQDVESVFRA